VYVNTCRLRDWLEMRIGDRRYPGLRWEDEQKKIFRIPWKHGARHGWREENDARLFREWSEHTGKGRSGMLVQLAYVRLIAGDNTVGTLTPITCIFPAQE